MINNSYLLGLYGVDTTTTTAATSTSSTTKRTQPTAPWTATENVPTASEMVRSALAGRRIVNETAVDVDLAGASADYRKLFATYQALETLSALADRAGTRGISTSESALLNKRFAAGVAELSTYLSQTDFDGFRMVSGVAQNTVKTSAAIEKAPSTFVTAPLHEGALTETVAAFEGDVRFSIGVSISGGTQKTIDIDLADMGATPRTFDNVTAFMNAELEAAGVETRIGREQIPGEAKTVKVGDKTVTLPAGSDKWALKVWGAAGETVSFSAADTSDAVYVTQKTGVGSEILKFQVDGGAAPDATQGLGESFWVEGRTGQTKLPEGVAAVRDSAVAADGSVWVLADLTEGEGSQPIKGQRDVALLKYDTAGNLVQTKLLGAASTANGFSLAIADDGRIAVAGSVTGALEPGKSGDDATVADSFVTLFDASGKEIWTQRRGAKAADEATEVTFGADGTVYVAGRSRSLMPGAEGVLGGWDGYLQAFGEQRLTPISPLTGKSLGLTQFGSAGDDSVQAMTVSGSDLYTAGVENGRFVVRQFALDASGVPTLSSTRDLGAAQGSIAGIAVEDGRVIVTGQTDNTALDVAGATNAHAGGTDVFVAVLEPDLQASADEVLTYYGGAGTDTAADVQVKDGKVWITGVADRAGNAAKTDPTQAYLARLDPLTGTVECSQTWRAQGDQAVTGSLVVASGGASVLDRLGLPQGEIMQTDSKLLTVATALRAGDQFSVVPGNSSRAVTVTIAANETMATLARKITSASNRQLVATVVTDKKVTPPVERIEIKAAEGKQGATLQAGAAGKDALAALGLSPGFVSVAGSKSEKVYGLNLTNSLNLSGADAIKAATDALSVALTTVRSAYKSLAPSTATATNTLTGKGSSTAYQQTQLANFQAALTRLTA